MPSTDYDRLAQLLGSVRSINWKTRGAMLEEDGLVGGVGPQVCAFCGTVGDQPCIHKDAAELAVLTWEHEANDDGDLHETQADALAWAIQ